MNYYGFVYITTNILNNKKYIGQCSGDPNSNTVKNYFGSGKAIIRAIKKNGKEFFSKEIICFANSLEELNELERKIIKEHNAVNSKLYYNIAPGGRASLGFTGKKHTASRNSKISKAMLEFHPRAKPITIDGETFKTIGHCMKETDYSLTKLKRYIDSNIHPNDQIKPKIIRKNPHPGGKAWKLEHISGETIITKHLGKWCKDNNISYMIRDKKDKFYYDWKISEIIE
jgi:hypothetical protein